MQFLSSIAPVLDFLFLCFCGVFCLFGARLAMSLNKAMVAAYGSFIDAPELIFSAFLAALAVSNADPIALFWAAVFPLDCTRPGRVLVWSFSPGPPRVRALTATVPLPNTLVFFVLKSNPPSPLLLSPPHPHPPASGAPLVPYRRAMCTREGAFSASVGYPVSNLSLSRLEFKFSFLPLCLL